MPTDANSSGSPPSGVPAWPTARRARPVAPAPVRRLVALAHERRDGLATGAARLAERAAGEPDAGLTFGRMRLRNTFSITSRGDADGHEHHLVTAPKRGPERRRAREAILGVLRRAERQGHRVAVVLTLGDYTQLRVGPPAGYDPAAALLQCRGQGDDPFEWCAKEHLRQRAEVVRADTIIGVELETWRATRPSARRPTR